MAEKISKKIVSQLMSLRGEARGIALKTDGIFVKENLGADALSRLEDNLKALGEPLEYNKIREMDFYPLGLRVLSLLTIKELFQFSDEKIKTMGRVAPKISFLVKIFMRYFFSLQKTMEEVPKMWREHYTVGNLKSKLDSEKKTAYLTLEDFVARPILFHYLEGYFETVLKMVVGLPVVCREIKPCQKGEKTHCYLLRW